MDLMRQTEKLERVGFERRECAPLPPRLVLVLGGARSGKSTFAERLAASSGQRVTYIATATPIDDEMRTRIARHRAERPTDWSTIEEPLQLAQAICQGAVEADILLIDCLTLWLNNWLGSRGVQEWDDTTMQQQIEAVLPEVEQLVQMIAALPMGKTVIAVSNEVGLGLVPAYPLGRAYRDALGWVNQRLAHEADRVYLMIAGLGIDLKSLHEVATL